MIDAGTERLVYGSTSAVVSDPESELGLAHGTVERLLSRLGGQYPLRHVNLRMFTVSGADLAGDIGQDQRTDPPLIPRLFRSALGLAQEAELRTQGGIPLVRDYVHVTDVARAHLQAIDALDIDKRGDEVSGSSIDLATGVGISETELAEAAASVVGNRSLPSRRVEAEEGVSVSIVGDPAGARDLLGWEPQFSDRETILETAWAWHRGHPTGFTVARSSSTDPSKSEKFGAVAIRLGFATPSDVQRALDRQDRESQEGGEHKLIGLHMLELGILSTSQLIEILRTYDETAAP